MKKLLWIFLIFIAIGMYQKTPELLWIGVGLFVLYKLFSSKSENKKITNEYPPAIHTDNYNIIVASVKPKGKRWSVKFAKRGQKSTVERTISKGTISGNISVSGERGNFYVDW